MKKSIWIILGLFAVVVLLDLAMTTERYSEINWATGARRSRTTRALVFRGDWEERPTWLSERAKELGLNSEHEWQFLSRKTMAHLMVNHASGRAPASYQITLLDPKELTREQKDQFVVRFVQGNETEREALIRNLAEGSFAVPPP